MTAPGAVVFGSFDAERSWRPVDAAVLPTVPDRQAARVVAGLDEVLAPVCGAGDLPVTRCAAPDALGADAVAQVLGGAGLCAPRTAVPGDPELGVEQRLVAAADVLRPRLRGRRARPYALTGAVADACTALDMHLAPTPGHAPPPDPAAVARVNAKTWSNDLVLERGFAGAARRVRSVRALRDAAADLPVVVKDPYGVAGQGAIRVAERGTLDSVVRHLARQETRGRDIDLLVQPLFAPGTDFSAHFAVDADGTPVFTGLCETLNDGFSYRGSRPMPHALGQRIARLGYLESPRPAGNRSPGTNGSTTRGCWRTAADGAWERTATAPRRFRPAGSPSTWSCTIWRTRCRADPATGGSPSTPHGTRGTTAACLLSAIYTQPGALCAFQYLPAYGRTLPVAFGAATGVVVEHDRMAYARTHGMDVGITRCGNNYGPYQHPEKLVPRFVTTLLDGGTVPLYGDGGHTREWIHVEDHCRAIRLVLAHGAPGGVYNVGGGTELTNREITSRLLDACGADWGSVRYAEDRKGHDRRYALDDTRLRRLGHRPRVAFERGLAETVAWYRDNPAWWKGRA